MSLIVPLSILVEELNVMKAFIEKQEFQIEEFAKTLESHIGVVDIERYDQDHPDAEPYSYIDQIEHIAGITEEEYDIRGLFLEIMPRYQRAAMLITLWGMFEGELEKMCKAIGLATRERCKADDTKGVNKVRHLLSEMKKLGVLNNASNDFNDSVNILIDEVCIIRNAWAHNGGKDIKDRLPWPIEGITTKHPQIVITYEYIDKVIDHMLNVARELNDSAHPILLSAIKANR